MNKEQRAKLKKITYSRRLTLDSVCQSYVGAITPTILELIEPLFAKFPEVYSVEWTYIVDSRGEGDYYGVLYDNGSDVKIQSEDGESLTAGFPIETFECDPKRYYGYRREESPYIRAFMSAMNTDEVTESLEQALGPASIRINRAGYIDIIAYIGNEPYKE